MSPSPTDRIQRSDDHLAQATGYPDEKYYLNEVQYYFFRNPALRELRVEQFFRYFSHGDIDTARDRIPTAQRTDENTVRDAINVPDADDPAHRHYSSVASAASRPGEGLRCGLWAKGVRIKSAVRRSNLNLCVCRTAVLQPLGKDRADFYEQRLLLGLPWHCPKRPQTSRRRGQTEVTWTSATHAPNTPCGAAVVSP